MGGEAQRYARIHAVLSGARGLTGARLESYLAGACGSDRQLRAEITAMLAAGSDEGADDALADRHVSDLRLALEGLLKDTDADEVPHAPGADPGAPMQLDWSGFSSATLERLTGRRDGNARYVFKGKVAEGGQGTIHRVWDEDLQRILAMKVMLGHGGSRRTEATPGNPKTLGRFLEEAQVTGQLEHPGIVPVHELGLDAQGRVYFTMRLVEGETLSSVFEKVRGGVDRWTQTRALGVLLRVCEAMAYAHDKGVIHRDLKPSNVMVGRFGEVFVMDWGLARVLEQKDHRDLRLEPSQATERRETPEDPDSRLLTLDGDVIGTPQYMSPEQANGLIDEMGPPSDVYSVGAMLYELLAGHPPYVNPGTKPTAHGIVYRVQQGPPDPLHKRAPRAPAELIAICERAMVRGPDERYGDMSALAEDLSAFLEGKVVTAYETGALAELRKWVLRNRTLSGAFGAAALTLVAGLVVALTLKAQSDRFAALASNRGDALQLANENLQARSREAEARRDEVLELSALQDIEDLLAKANELWPAYPDRIDAYDEWIRAARALAEELPVHDAKRSELRSRALERTEEQRMAERESHPDHARFVQAERSVEQLEEALAAARSEDEIERAERTLAETRARRTELDARLNERRDWRFPDTESEARWWNNQLTKLIDELGVLTELLADEQTAVSSAHGWSVPRRLAFAQRLQAGHAAGGEYTERWNEALPGIRSAYPELDPKPQLGLVPLGADPASGLWEFADLASGRAPERDAQGQLVRTEESALVFVLIPGGAFTMGAQSSETRGENHDPRAQPNEGPPHRVTLSPFLLSKYEMTQGQWLGFTNHNPSIYRPPDRLAPSLLHPVETVDWSSCMETCARLGVTLPTEAQWEYAARAGTTSAWWTGDERESLWTRAAANVADRTASRGTSWTVLFEAWDDGHVVHAPVGSFAPNPFGIHDIHGNVWEWCRDAFSSSFYADADGTDPVNPPTESSRIVYRGGSFNAPAASARSAYRDYDSPALAHNSTGLRPARTWMR